MPRDLLIFRSLRTSAATTGFRDIGNKTRQIAIILDTIRVLLLRFPTGMYMSRLKPDPLAAESFREFYTQILHFLRKRTDNASDAADMTQDVFTQWLGYQDRAKVEQPRAFLFQVARNLLRDHWRRQQVRHEAHSEHLQPVTEPLSDERDEPMAAAQRLQRLEQLKSVLAELSPRRREALMLHRFEGLSQAQIAERMGISVSMVEKHIAFALLHCKQHLHRDSGKEQPK